MSRQYNFIYKQLVAGEDDVVGHVAYSLYKSAKIQFIERFKEQHEGAEPSEEDFAKFHEVCCLEQSITGYKMQAFSIVKDFLDDTLASVTKQMEYDYAVHQNECLEKIIEPVKPMPLAKAYLHGIVQSILGAFIFMLLLCGLLFLLKFSDTQYTFTFGGNGNATIETTAPPAASTDTIQ